MKDNEKKFIPFINRNESSKLSTDEVCYILRAGRTIRFITDEGEKKNYGRIDNVMVYVGPEFYRCSPGCVVNLSRIKKVSEGIVLFNNGIIYEPSREAYTKIKIRFNAYLFNMLAEE